MVSSKKILIVEDDAFMRYMVRSIIETLDVELMIDVAEDGLVGCEKVEADPAAYALILMDIHMPRMSGLDATKRIRDCPQDPPRNIPIFAVTADSDFHHPLAVEKHGLNGFIAKPVSPGELVGLVEKYCVGD